MSVHFAYQFSDLPYAVFVFQLAGMKAVVLKRCDRDLAYAIDALEITTRPIPRPSRGQVLVRMAAAPCNQSDLLLIRGMYGVKKRLPTVPGWEGTGTVVDHGGGLVARWLMGKRVACGGQEDRDGTWAEYFVAGATGCIPLGKEISWEQGASLLVNPLTAVGLLDEAKKLGARPAVQNAGMSQAGRMLVPAFRLGGHTPDHYHPPPGTGGAAAGNRGVACAEQRVSRIPGKAAAPGT